MSTPIRHKKEGVNYSMVGASACPIPEEPSPARASPCCWVTPPSESTEYVSFTELFEAVAEPDVPYRSGRARHRRPNQSSVLHLHPSSWTCLAEWVLGDWARTLRAVVLVIVTSVVCSVLVGVLVALYGAAAVVGWLTLLRLVPPWQQRPKLA